MIETAYVVIGGNLYYAENLNCETCGKPLKAVTQNQQVSFRCGNDSCRPNWSGQIVQDLGSVQQVTMVPVARRQSM
jgi:hypothetical protein